jgi:hypothetical protein
MSSADEKAFPTDKATEIIKEQITSVIGDQNYSRSHAEQWSKSISENIAEELKKLNLDDIKFVINITLLEKTDKCCSTASQCIWDSDKDRQIKVRWENKGLHVFADVFALSFVY